ncbi:glycosyltransferase family 2 protein [Listeria seeligeri]|uniref:glycosyltransferase family 2 protein n=1 Tax=Listeria seeligeri TaxID=1640 RepID=UPI00162471EB|nr:glycosyltransferase family 2 protein [Listeria seeligeri]MBC1826621.1 glycosyltransferase family 2 protein [Listeria seeligeri]MBC1870025.1 glycosyltransferase family 2 protein [Listeria seeligeri]MBM5598043.1 glycosyltransferase family 2 protein [Listeria seeligeri]MBM5606500.1 glycosyltransferase family 2 protein [Listeria seeligeri]MBM5611945.1 glycosyltransferase family 2 protein [Listeria seeligeri]
MYNNQQVSVIMPCYNAEDVIDMSIQSVLAQSYQNFQLIIVDDYSTDRTIVKIKPYLADNRILLVQLPRNSGVANARNIGMQHSLGRFIAFLDCDDVWRPEKLEKQVTMMESNDAPLVFSAYHTFIEGTDKPIKKIQVPEFIDYEGLLRNTIIGCLTVMVDRNKTGDFEMPNIPGGEDTATWLNLLKQNGVAYGAEESLAYYRVSSTSLSGNKWRMARRTWQMYRQTQDLSFIKTCICFSFYVKNAIVKRI